MYVYLLNNNNNINLIFHMKIVDYIILMQIISNRTKEKKIIFVSYIILCIS